LRHPWCPDLSRPHASQVDDVKLEDEDNWKGKIERETPNGSREDEEQAVRQLAVRAPQTKERKARKSS
jgi:hypothetical protein